MPLKTAVRAALVALAFVAGGLAVAAPAQAEATTDTAAVAPASQERDGFGTFDNDCCNH
ncbi:hypothetical protein [Glycomyces harbinensis]|uniref:Uncharacterized protein n=1 Tax=Glycomyces harbinensis TaxID=58114 RepID=A0A1G6WV82_9ACTN|nr:hypothetical protein [Glycomyces harbinensis]SDD68996.1 hypothetical protein SAMN05216270_106196 [Glycomyces harbinensis]